MEEIAGWLVRIITPLRLLHFRCLATDKRGGGLFKKKSHKPTRAMDDSGVDAMQKLVVGGGMHPLRRQASDTNLTSAADYSARAGVKGGVGSAGAGAGMQTAGGGAGKRAKSPFAIFRRPKPRDQSPMGAAGDMQPGRDTLPIHITVSHVCHFN